MTKWDNLVFILLQPCFYDLSWQRQNFILKESASGGLEPFSHKPAVRHVNDTVDLPSDLLPPSRRLSSVGQLSEAGLVSASASAAIPIGPRRRRRPCSAFRRRRRRCRNRSRRSRRSRW